ncbi:MAG: sigma-70 family RNA polymerase sigma factor [Kiritimatiellae bacterium]|nr:sigma-70 family RNA polymerase sigma factor [Kiritimatiellia bacterium]
MKNDVYQEVTAQIVRHRGILFAFILSIVKNHHLAEDLFQDTCVVISSKCDQYRPGTNFLAWARSIALREIKGIHKNKRYRNVEFSAENAELIAELWTRRREPSHIQARKAALEACLRGLKARAFKVFRAFYESGSACEEIAGDLRTSVPAIHMLLKRTREKLAGCIRKKMAVTS